MTTWMYPASLVWFPPGFIWSKNLSYLANLFGDITAATDFPGGLVVKNSPANVGDAWSSLACMHTHTEAYLIC